MFTLLSTSDTDLLSARASGADYVWANPAPPGHQSMAATIEGADLVVGRILGSPHDLCTGFARIRETGVPMVVRSVEDPSLGPVLSLSVAGDATDLPFADNSFDACTISFGLRNVNEPKKALAEMLRVTRPGGRLVIAEFSQPTVALWRTTYTEYLMRALPAIARKVSSNPDAYVYLAESIRAWPNQDQLAAWIGDSGWGGVRYRNLNGGIVAVHRATKAPAAPGEEPLLPGQVRLRRRTTAVD